MICSTFLELHHRKNGKQNIRTWQWHFVLRTEIMILERFKHGYAWARSKLKMLIFHLIIPQNLKPDFAS